MFPKPSEEKKRLGAPLPEDSMTWKREIA